MDRNELTNHFQRLNSRIKSVVDTSRPYSMHNSPKSGLNILNIEV